MSFRAPTAIPLSSPVANQACKGTVLFGARLAPERVESVLEHVAEGCGVRQTGRLFKVNRKTVGRLSRLAGEHARDLHDELVAIPPPHARGPVR